MRRETQYPPLKEIAPAVTGGESTEGAFSFTMTNWKPFKTPPDMNARIIAVFYWPDMEDYCMEILVWQGKWPSQDMEANNWGKGTLGVRWTEAPEYPEDLD